jgi:uncharacterized protein YcfJ
MSTGPPREIAKKTPENRMKKVVSRSIPSFFVLAVALASAPMPGLVRASSSSTSSATSSSTDSAYRSPGENVTYGYAQVLRAEPVYETVSYRQPDSRCGYDNTYSNKSGTTSAVVGALVGGALGNQVGKGDGRTAATIAGVVAGAVIGKQVGTQGNNVREVCESSGQLYHEERRITGYDVEYQYKGEKYMSRLPYDPGDRLRIRVSVLPEDQASDYYGNYH